MNTHELIRIKLLNEQWCTAGTKRELACHIRDKMSESLGSYMKSRYSVEDIEAQLSDPVVCAEDGSRRHYLFEAGNFSYCQ